jgi:hypothetical protein
MSEGRMIFPKDLGLERRETRPGIQTLKQAKDKTEKSVILFTLRWTNQKIPEAARLLDVTRATLYRLIDKHNIDIHIDKTHKEPKIDTLKKEKRITPPKSNPFFDKKDKVF